MENHSDEKITYGITVLTKTHLIKFMHIAASLREILTVYKSLHSTLKTRTTPKLATAIRYLIYEHSTFLRHKVIRALSNATVV